MDLTIQLWLVKVSLVVQKSVVAISAMAEMTAAYKAVVREGVCQVEGEGVQAVEAVEAEMAVAPARRIGWLRRQWTWAHQGRI